MATLTTLPPLPVTPHRRWNTLEILSRSRLVLFVLVALLLAAIVFATQVHRGAMQLLGNDTAPSIIAAQEIKSGLAHMDADAVDDLLAPGSTQFAGLFDDHRIQTSESLIDAAKNITFENERAPIETLQVSIGTYVRLVQEARDLQDDAQAETDADKAKMAVRYYRAAGIVMDGTLLPAADELDKANSDMLEQEYDSQSNRSLVARVLVLLLGVALLAALAMAQLFLSRRMQRTLNLPLLAATLITLGLTIFAFAAMAREQSDLHAAKQDAFDSARALLRARAVAYAASSDEGRTLLDPLHAGEYEQDFDRGAATLAALPPQMTDAQFATELRAGEPVAGFTGLLADELKNITYPGERDAADETAADFVRYRSTARNLLALDRSGQHQQAVASVIGEEEDQAGWEFKQFDAALGKTLAINVHEFELARASGFSDVKNVEWESGVAGLVLAVLIFFGFAPRIREYQ